MSKKLSIASACVALLGGAFGACVGFFGGLYAYGYLTQSNLSGLVAIFFFAPICAVVGAYVAYRLMVRRNP
jgi:FtsH-binding integral membrane protein